MMYAPTLVQAMKKVLEAVRNDLKPNCVSVMSYHIDAGRCLCGGFSYKVIGSNKRHPHNRGRQGKKETPEYEHECIICKRCSF